MGRLNLADAEYKPAAAFCLLNGEKALMAACADVILRMRTACVARKRKIYFAFEPTAGSTVCTDPALRTWIVAISSV